MNLHTLHVINDRLQTAIRTEDLDRICVVCLELSAEATDLIRRDERRQVMGLPPELPETIPPFKIPPWASVRPDIIEGIRQFADKGIPPGDFLWAVLSNDLKEAFGRADEGNIAAMFGIMSYCYNEIPSDCWGSIQKVNAWLAFKAKAREAKAAAASPVESGDEKE